MYCRDNPPHRYRSWHVVCFLVFLSWKQNITNYKNFSLNRSKTNWRLGAYFQTESLTAKWVHFGILNTNPRISLQQKSSKLLTSLPRSCGVFFFVVFMLFFTSFFLYLPLQTFDAFIISINSTQNALSTSYSRVWEISEHRFSVPVKLVLILVYHNKPNWPCPKISSIQNL